MLEEHKIYMEKEKRKRRSIYTNYQNPLKEVEVFKEFNLVHKDFTPQDFLEDGKEFSKAELQILSIYLKIVNDYYKGVNVRAENMIKALVEIHKIVKPVGGLEEYLEEISFEL